MQPRVTVVLAIVWLTVAVLVGGAVTLHLSHDQYSPVSPRRHARVQRDHTGVWRDHYPAEDQTLDLWITSRRSISAEEPGALFRNATERDFQLEGFLKDIVSSKRMYPFSGWQRRLSNIAGAQFATDKVDYGYEMPETLSHEAEVSPSDLLNDLFVADDTFQDQGPGSMEIYKLDLSKEKTLLTATTPSTNLLSKNKSKAPKKNLNSKTKTTEVKSTTINANINHRQSNFFEEQRTDTPLINEDAFDVGGVPELQVGCEGLEASLSSHKTKRSIDTPDKEKGEVPASVLLNVSPVSLDLGDVLSYDEEEYEEMDELLKLKRLETTTKRNKPNRGDMDASHLNSDHLDEFRRPEKLPERGDLGGSIPINSSESITSKQKTKRSLTDLEIKNYEEAEPKRKTVSLYGDNGASKSHGRRLLWFAKANTEGFADGRNERKRTRRSIDWGFGEDEGVVSSNELQTVNERRRQHEMRYHQDTSRRRDQHHGLNTDTDVRQEYEKLLEQKRREEEYLRRMQQANQRPSNKREEEEKNRKDELRRRQYEEYRKKMNISTHRIDNEDMRRQIQERQEQMQEAVRRNEEELRRREEEERRLQEEEIKRRPQNKWQEKNFKKSGSKTSVRDDERKRTPYDEEMKRREEEQRSRLEEEQARRQEQYRSQQEAQRKREEETRRQDSMRNFSENDKRKLEDRRREWSKKRQEDEDERRRQQPSNLMHAEHSVSHPNDIRQRDRDEKRQQHEERQRKQKLQEYITRNRPINVNHVDQRSEEEKRRYRLEEYRDPRMNVSRNDEEYRRRLEERKRQQEERKLQDYIRRNQPVNVPSRDNQSTTAGRNWFEEQRLIEKARRRDRYPDLGVRRDHGPSAPTYIDPRSSPEEVRRRQQETARRLEEERRQRYEAEERRKELARRQWEEEEERRLRQQRMREEAARREEEARREQSRRYEENRKQLEIARIQAERRRQEMLKQRSRNEVGRTKQPEITRPIYHQNPRLLAEHRRRQDSRPIPSNLMRAEEARRAVAEHERQRLEAEKRQQEESRMREHTQKEIFTEQWKRQELARLNSLPVSARIIVRPGSSSPTSPVSPPVISRNGFNNEIDFTGINPHREGVQVAQFPVPPTPRPPAQSPAPCVWAVVHCCSSNNNRLVKCFESLGCPGINWDPNPCRGPVADAARTEVLKFYANS
ncbi:PREDICTED: trichohyalin [Cyphomyrmex costatus]|uniref:trichohyalin n=1 Tax=Cyphomyrmex costatus TaxID=456900 RepID=UPI00085242B5|nr:PREDICTED: trichohyalin [Cyphomyrmex costatus]